MNTKTFAAGLALITGVLWLVNAASQDAADTAGGRARDQAQPIPAAGDPRLVGVLTPVLEKHKLPAMAAAIVTSRGVESLAVAGVRKRGTKTAVSTNDLWHLGSDTKAMTATLAAKLVERGQLQWDLTPAAAFPELASDFHSNYTGVTLRHLLSHRAGLVANLDWRQIARRGDLREQRLAAVRQGLKTAPESQPGTAFLYSNLGYVIAGAMIERKLDQSWEEAMRTEIFEPLGMTSAGFGGLGTRGKLDQPWGHEKGGKPSKENGPSADNAAVLGPAGTVHCSLADWGRFVADHLRGLRGEKALLQPESYQALIRPPFGGEYALGWLVVPRPWADGEALNHCGCNTLYYANAWLAPRRNIAVLVCANQGEDAFQATDEVAGELVTRPAPNAP